MTIEHLVSPDEFLKLLSDFVLVSKSQLTDEECELAGQLSNQILGVVGTEKISNLRCLIVAAGSLLHSSVEQVIAKAKNDRGIKAMRFKETFQ